MHLVWQLQHMHAPARAEWDLEMDQQLMQRDMEELSKQAQQAVAALKCVFSDSISSSAAVHA